MICYKDMTFCPYFRECIDGDECFRALHDDIIQECTRLGLSISQFIEKPECFNIEK